MYQRNFDKFELLKIQATTNSSFKVQKLYLGEYGLFHVLKIYLPIL